VHLAHVGSHDTASAVAGFGTLAADEVFLNVGTWSLLGTVLDHPLATVAAEDAGYTNERCVDGKVRFLRNIPGFYVINRLHEELGCSVSVPEWLNSGLKEVDETIDLFAPEFFNPESMLEACRAGLSKAPNSLAGWAELALRSLVSCCASQVVPLGELTGREFKRIRVGGGGSQSELFCQGLANMSGLEIVTGAAEVTVLGNLALQFAAQGKLGAQDWDEVLRNSAISRVYKA
jgi:rhamnulokinase